MLLNKVSSLKLVYKVLFALALALLSIVLTSCHSVKHMSVLVDNAENLKVDYLDSVRVELKR